MANKVKSVNYWNLAIGRGSEDLLSNLILKGCIFESEEKVNFFIKDSENNDKAINSILNDNLRKRVFNSSTASYEILKNTLSKVLKNLSDDKDFNYKLSSNAISLSYVGAISGEDEYNIAYDLGGDYSDETDSAQFNEVYEDIFDEEQKIIVAWSWTYNFLNEPKFENDIKNQKLLDICSELTATSRSLILEEELKEDELKTESKADNKFEQSTYNKMVYFKI